MVTFTSTSTILCLHPNSPEQLSALQNEFPRWYLLAQEKTALWHEFGMEWKEHVAWISPILATVVFFAVLYYGPRLAYEPRIRQTLLLIFVLSFVAAAVAGLFGALITKAAPIL